MEPNITTSIAEQSEKRFSVLSEISKSQGPWLNSWHDPVANLNAFSSCVVTADLNSDGNFALLVADESRLRVFKGINLISCHKLLDEPCGMTVFYPEASKSHASSATPAIAVAAASHLYIYRNLRPYYKFSLPPVEIDAAEVDLWTSLRTEQIDGSALINGLTRLRDQKHELTYRSKLVLSFTEVAQQNRFVANFKDSPLVVQTNITCLATIAHEVEQFGSESQVLLGTETGQVVVLNPSGMNSIATYQISGVPSSIVTFGCYNVDYRIIVATREGSIHTIKNGNILGSMIFLEAAIVAMAVVGRSIMAATSNQAMSAFSFKGAKQYSLSFDSRITCMTPVKSSRFHDRMLYIIGFRNGQVRMYEENLHVHTLELDPIPITAVLFDHYGREENSLIVLNQTGALTVKILKRTAKLELSAHGSGRLKEQEEPLSLPAVTQLAVDQIQREMQFGAEMHRSFQKELVKLRLKTARQYVKVIQDGIGPMSNAAGKQLILNVQVMGLGPIFHLKIELKNVSKRHVCDIPIMCSFDRECYELTPRVLRVPVLVPNVMYNFRIQVRSIDAEGKACPIRIIVGDNNVQNHFPLIAAVVEMPVSEVME